MTSLYNKQTSPWSTYHSHQLVVVTLRGKMPAGAYRRTNAIHWIPIHWIQKTFGACQLLLVDYQKPASQIHSQSSRSSPHGNIPRNEWKTSARARPCTFEASSEARRLSSTNHSSGVKKYNIQSNSFLVIERSAHMFNKMDCTDLPM